MRLLIFIYSLESGGAERVTTHLANYWAMRGWEITIITLVSTNTDFYKLHPRIKRVAFDLTCDSRKLLSRLSRNMRRVKDLRRALREIQPDVALAMMSAANVILALAARGMSNVCAIGSERTFPPQLPLGAIWESLRRHTYGQLAAVVTLTQECAHWTEEHSSARRVSVIPNPACWPLPEHEPKINRSEVCSSERRLLLAVGRLDKAKNFELLIDVFSCLAQRHPDWDLVILGEGAERKGLEAQVTARGLGKRAFLPGRIGNVGEWYEQADLYVMTSRFEGFPNTLAEALSHGLAAVSFDCDTGPRDIIRHGIDGLLVPPGNSLELMLALEKMMSNSSLRERLASKAVDARERFSMEKIAYMWEDLFNQCMQIKREQASNV